MSATTTLTMANTKKEMLEALEDARKSIQEQQKVLATSEGARKKLEERLATAEADEAVEKSPVERLNQLRLDMARELNALAGMYESELGTYQRIKLAVETKRAELKTFHDMDLAASDLEALLHAQQQRKIDFEKNMKERRDALDTEMSAARADWEQEEEAHLAHVTERKAELEKSRKREQEEYEYLRNRERDRKENEMKDRLAQIQRDIQERTASFDFSVKTREGELTRREETIAEQEAELTKLRLLVERFAGEKEASIGSACEELTQRLEADFRKSEMLMQARFDGERNVLQSRITLYEKQLAELMAQLSESAKKQDLAYEKVQDIASKAVAAAKREIISISSEKSAKE